MSHNHGGMDMDSGDSSSGHMMMTFHFSAGDALWFDGWTPTSAGAVFGACFGLFLLSVFGRLLLVLTYQLNIAFRTRSVETLQAQYLRLIGENTEHLSDSNGSAAIKEKENALARARRRVSIAPPFVWTHEVARGVVVTAMVTVGYLLMLAVMTGNLYYFFAILLGVFAGEIAFGRYGQTSAH